MVTSFLSTLHCHLGPAGEEFSSTDELGIPLKIGWATVALVQFCDKAALLANHLFTVHARAAIELDDLSAAVNEALTPLDAVTRLKWDWESLWIKCGKSLSTWNGLFWVLQQQIEPHALLFTEHLCNSYQVNLQSNPELSKPLIETLCSQPTTPLDNIMEHISQVDAMLTCKL